MKTFLVTCSFEYEIKAKTQQEAIEEVCDRFDMNDMVEVEEVKK
tara:strand:- start:347 stop:478 length:132 start_codon:yes stop_codon:yes gene_type:complete